MREKNSLRAYLFQYVEQENWYIAQNGLKMIRAFLFSALFSVSGNTILCQPIPDLALENLQGRIKSLTISTTVKVSSPYDDYISSVKGAYLLRKVFDECGYRKMHLTLNKKGRVLGITRFLYDDSGYCKKSLHYDSQGIMVYYTNFQHFRKADGFIIIEHFFNHKDSLFRRKTLEYNNSNLLIAYCDYYPLDTLRMKQSFYYTSDTLVRSTIQVVREKLPRNFHYEYSRYDSKGNWLIREMYLTYSRGFLVEFRDFEYYD